MAAVAWATAVEAVWATTCAHLLCVMVATAATARAAATQVVTVGMRQRSRRTEHRGRRREWTARQVAPATRVHTARHHPFAASVMAGGA